jgi:protein-S-isoprenylcysteine O-methyltransferase Ste14
MAKPSKAYDASFVAAISTVAATFYFLFIELDSGFEIINRSIASVGQVLAIGWQIWAKIHLGRSFGLMPANRGIVTNGPYRIVRHPIYFGYFLNHLFFLMAHFSMGNLMLYAGVYFLQGVRIWREEALLKQDGDYKEYMIKTKYRFIPGLF